MGTSCYADVSIKVMTSSLCIGYMRNIPLKSIFPSFFNSLSIAPTVSQCFVSPTLTIVSYEHDPPDSFNVSMIHSAPKTQRIITTAGDETVVSVLIDTRTLVHLRDLSRFFDFLRHLSESTLVLYKRQTMLILHRLPISYCKNYEGETWTGELQRVAHLREQMSMLMLKEARTEANHIEWVQREGEKDGSSTYLNKDKHERGRSKGDGDSVKLVLEQVLGDRESVRCSIYELKRFCSPMLGVMRSFCFPMTSWVWFSKIRGGEQGDSMLRSLGHCLWDRIESEFGGG